MQIKPWEIGSISNKNTQPSRIQCQYCQLQIISKKKKSHQNGMKTLNSMFYARNHLLRYLRS